jgi:hypothetical protein
MANTTFNPSDKAAGVTLTGSNLIATASAGGNVAVRTVDRQVSGQFYWEYTYTNNTNTSCGLANQSVSMTGVAAASGNTPGTVLLLPSGGSLVVNAVATGILFGSIANGTVTGWALDLTNRLLWVRIGAAGNWNNNAANSPVTGVGGVSVASVCGVGIPAYGLMGATNGNPSGAITANFGDTAFTGAVPSGYTSGFTAGASVPTNALASQALAEHWLTTNPDARITQVVAEHWASVASGNLQAVVTQVLLEHWTSVAVVVPAAGGPMVTMIH